MCNSISIAIVGLQASMLLKSFLLAIYPQESCMPNFEKACMQVYEGQEDQSRLRRTNMIDKLQSRMVDSKVDNMSSKSECYTIAAF